MFELNKLWDFNKQPFDEIRFCQTGTANQTQSPNKKGPTPEVQTCRSLPTLSEFPIWSLALFPFPFLRIDINLQTSTLLKSSSTMPAGAQTKPWLKKTIIW